MTTERVLLHDITRSGEAVGRRQNGQVVFVPHGVPGDDVEVTLTAQRKGYARGTIVRWLAHSPHRVTPPCALASGACGGCPWMHLSRTAQHAAKQAWVEQALRHTGVPVLPMHTPTPDLGYRIRARFVCRQGVLGFQTADSHNTHAIAHCPVLAPALNDVLCTLARELQPWIGEEGTLSGLANPTNQVHIAITTGTKPHVQKLQHLLRAWHQHNRIAGARCDNWTLGTPALNLGTASLPFWSHAAGFAQASVAGHNQLPQYVTSLLPSTPTRILELHAGSGNFTRWLHAQGHHVTVVESDAPALERLHQALPTVETIHSPALQALQRFAAQRRTFDAVVLDPPRVGARDEMPWLARLQPASIVYVSCDPMTLARDVAVLQAHGYTPDTFQPFDLVPHTPHAEVVCRLTHPQKPL